MYPNPCFSKFADNYPLQAHNGTMMCEQMIGDQTKTAPPPRSLAPLFPCCLPSRSLPSRSLVPCPPVPLAQVFFGPLFPWSLGPCLPGPCLYPTPHAVL
jgi:hypothetical protein